MVRESAADKYWVATDFQFGIWKVYFRVLQNSKPHWKTGRSTQLIYPNKSFISHCWYNQCEGTCGFCLLEVIQWTGSVNHHFSLHILRINKNIQVLGMWHCSWHSEELCWLLKIRALQFLRTQGTTVPLNTRHYSTSEHKEHKALQSLRTQGTTVPQNTRHYATSEHKALCYLRTQGTTVPLNTRHYSPSEHKALQFLRTQGTTVPLNTRHYSSSEH